MGHLLLAEPNTPSDRVHRAFVASYLTLVIGLGTNVVLGELRRGLNLSDTVTSLHGSFFGWFLLAGGIGGALLGRWSRRALINASVVMLGLGPVVVATGHHAGQTLLGAAIAGAGGALVVVVVPGSASDHHGDDYGTKFSRINAWAAGAGITFSLAVGLSLSLGYGWRWPLGVLPLIMAATTLALLARASLPDDSPVPSTHPVRMIRSDPEVRQHWWSIIIPTVCELSVAIWAVPLLRDVGGASAGMAPTLAALFAIGIMVGRFATDRHRGQAVLISGWLVLIGGGCLLWLGPGLAGRSAGVLLVGLGVAPHYPAAMEKLLRCRGDGRELSNVAAVASGLAVTLGPLALGVTADAVGLRIAPVVVPIVALIGLNRQLRA